MEDVPPQEHLTCRANEKETYGAAEVARSIQYARLEEEEVIRRLSKVR
jgi:hypothetical protein